VQLCPPIAGFLLVRLSPRVTVSNKHSRFHARVSTQSLGNSRFLESRTGDGSSNTLRGGLAVSNARDGDTLFCHLRGNRIKRTQGYIFNFLVQSPMAEEAASRGVLASPPGLIHRRFSPRRPARLCTDRLCNYLAGRLGPVSQRHQSLDQPPPGGTRRTIGHVYDRHSIFSTTPVRQVQSHKPSGFDIGANARFRHSTPSHSGEKKLVPRC
jgi:hypothetical protein